MYFESIQFSKLKEVMHHAPKALIKGKDIKFSERTKFHKCARIFYKLLRMQYVGVIFYFVPFSVMFIQTFSKYDVLEH